MVLFADAPGSVTAAGAEPGEVVRAGQMVVEPARQADVTPSSTAPSNSSAVADEIPWLILPQNDPQVKATAVREVAPQADSATRTFQVKVGIADPPASMKLGDTVVGRIKLSAPPGVEVPARR